MTSEAHYVETSDLLAALTELNRESATLLLRDAIMSSIAAQGFQIGAGGTIGPTCSDKDHYRALHRQAVAHLVHRAKPHLLPHEDSLVQRLASGATIEPTLIKPTLVEVVRRSHDELLFRWAKLHWSIPTSAGYGRRLRFLIVDGQNGKLMGILGLGDPVYALRPRDAWVGWDHISRRTTLAHVLDAFVLGAVPPYSHMLCGKLVAALATSLEIRSAFRAKYADSPSVIHGRRCEALALITTTSALGRSSMYNRLKYQARDLYQCVGSTLGSGDFHFANGIYDAIYLYATRYCPPTAKHEKWGAGYRNRREVVRKALVALSLPEHLLYHRIPREVYCAPLASNTKAFLRGEATSLLPYEASSASLAVAMLDRWVIPRSRRDQRFREFDAEDWRLWPNK